MLTFRRFEEGWGKKGSPDFTPLIDIMFNLLLFFVLTSSVMASSFLVTLPSMTSGEESAPPQHVLVLTREGGLYWDGRAISAKELALHLEKTHVQGESKRVAVEADTNVPFGRVTHVMDMIREKGFEEISFSVLAGEEGK